jgi:hypothetical protein
MNYLGGTGVAELVHNEELDGMCIRLAYFRLYNQEQWTDYNLQLDPNPWLTLYSSIPRTSPP